MKRKQRKKVSLKKLSPEDRKKNARKWLRQGLHKNLLESYCKRYRIPQPEGHLELLELGYGDHLRIEAYEREGIEWEYKVDGYSGDMKVVPKGTPDWELYLF